MLVALILLSGCGQLGAQLAIAGLSYVASANQLGAQTLKFIDDKEGRTCKPLPP